MNVNKKIDRLRQWAGERMGAEIKTSLSDDFKALEAETILRQEGMEKMHRAMANYTKSISKRADGEHGEKQLPIGQLGYQMMHHGDEFEHDSQYGQCLSAFGRTQERLGRSQEAYIGAATNTWLESMERSLAQTKEYQSARKKLDTRRLAYDTSLAKMQKAKKEDFRVEEELRSQKLKFEEAEEDVYRRMVEIKDAESYNTVDLTAFLDAQLAYHEACREALLQLRESWPADQSMTSSQMRSRPGIRSRSNTTRSITSTHSSIDERPAVPSTRSTRMPSQYLESPVERVTRPSFTRATTFDTQPHARRDLSPVHPDKLNRVPSDSLMSQNAQSNLRKVSRIETNVFADNPRYPSGTFDQSSGSLYSPADSQGSASTTSLSIKKRAPPPPPPSRATKPAPPPPPAKRTLMT